jgi:uncharacterized SAM-binding protein YcdF (DUF218 family)
MDPYTVIKSLLTPPGLLILMLIGAFLLARGVMARLLIFITAITLTLMTLPVVAILLMTPLEPTPALTVGSIPADAQGILVLGAGSDRAPEYGGDTVDGNSLQRIRYAAHLHGLTGLPIYVAGGSPPEEQPPVGLLMAKVLQTDFGVPVAGVEAESRTSWENAAFAKPMLERDGIGHVLLVSSAWHLPRAMEAVERAGLRVTPAPTGFVHYPGWQKDLGLADWLPSARALLDSTCAVREHLGQVWYQIRYWIQGAPSA